MARISRTGTTDSTGVASTTVTGTGGGRLKFISRNGGLWSNSYEVDDLIWFDNFTSDTLWRYMNGRVTTVYNDGIEVTITGSSPYVRIRQNYLPLSQVKGKRIHFEYTVEKPSNKTIQATIYKEINGSYVATNSQYTTENTVSLEVDVGDEVTNIIFQMSLTNFSSGESLKIKEVKVYPVFTAPKHYTPISLSSSASIIQTGETATLTAELTNVLGEKLTSKSVNFIEKSKLIAEDKGTSATHTDLFGASTKSQINRLANYSELLLKDGQTGFASMTYIILNAPIIFEIDMQIISQSTGWIATFRKSGGTITCGVSGANIGFSDENWHTLRFEVSYQQVDLYVDGEFEITRYPDAVFNHLEIDARDGSVINFKNFKVFQDTTIDTETSNSQGVATTTITSNQTGERQFIASNSSILSETYTIIDNTN